MRVNGPAWLKEAGKKAQVEEIDKQFPKERICASDYPLSAMGVMRSLTSSAHISLQ